MKYIGIDLGTTFSVAAYLDDLGVPQIIRNEDGENITPSCVAKINGALQVGQRAKRHAHNVPEEGAKTFKRRMGEEEERWQKAETGGHGPADQDAGDSSGYA